VCGLVKPFFKNKRTEIVKNPKVYFFDSGLRNVIVDDFRPFESRGDAGQLLENTLFMQLVKEGYDFNYWRDKKKNEIDFILRLENQKMVAVEVKSSLKNQSGGSVAHFEKTHPDIEVVFACLKLKLKAGERSDKKHIRSTRSRLLNKK
jgi:hypothetical protein